MISTAAAPFSSGAGGAVARKNLKKRALVLYHYPCPDGVFAALAAHLYFSSVSSTPALFFPNTVYSPIRLEQLPVTEADDVYLLDFVGSPGFIQQISPKVDRVVVLDHHKTALEMFEAETCSLGENVLKVIDMRRSGATIAYDYFKEKLLQGNSDSVTSDMASALSKFQSLRSLYDYIEDADLWRWSLINSKAFSSGLKDLGIEYDAGKNPLLFQQLLSLDLESIINQGTLSLSTKQKLIDEVLEKSFEIALGGGTSGYCLAVHADSISELRSELGHQLASKSRDMNLRGIGAVVYKVPELQNDSLLKISLRSLGNEDTTPISQAFGGGGHRNASSFILKASEFENWKVRADVSA